MASLGGRVLAAGILVVLSATAGCADNIATAGSNRTPTSPLRTAEQLCRAALANRDVTAWAPATVGDLRGYQYSGPKPRAPLRAAFPHARATRTGAWCWVRQRSQTGVLLGVVGGYAPRHAITITGPNRQPQGAMTGPPRVP